MTISTRSSSSALAGLALSFAALLASSDDFSPSTTYVLLFLSFVTYPGSSLFMVSATAYQHESQISALYVKLLRPKGARPDLVAFCERSYISAHMRQRYMAPRPNRTFLPQ